jgi:hypothetical protein
MRVSIEGRVHRFEQWSNPGGFAPVPQVAEPCDDGALGRCDEPVSFERFERDLDAAIARSKQAREALTSPTTSTAALLDWIGPPEGAPEARRIVLGGHVVDAIASRASELVAERGELGDLLESAARTRLGALASRRPVLRFGREDLARVAKSTSRSVREREAALGLLASAWFPGDEPSAAAIASFAPLLDDAEPRVRAAVIPILRAHPSADTFATWLRARHAKETDVEVMRAILHAARGVKALPFPEPPGVVVPELPSAQPAVSTAPTPSVTPSSSGAPELTLQSLEGHRESQSGCACMLAPGATRSRAGAASLLAGLASIGLVARRRRRARASSAGPR